MEFLASNLYLVVRSVLVAMFLLEAACRRLVRLLLMAVSGPVVALLLKHRLR